MPIIGSPRGTFGFGRMPRVEPAPILTIFNPVTQTTTTHNFNTTPTLALDGNLTIGNVYVVTTNTRVETKVKLWGAGGGSLVSSSINFPGTNTSGAGAAIQGTIIFESGQPYTIFLGGAGKYGGFYTKNDTWEEISGAGGAASGIIKGDIFSLGVNRDNFVQNHVAIAGGGGGVFRNRQTYPETGGGGGGRFPSFSTAESSEYGYVETLAGSGFQTDVAGLPSYSIVGTPSGFANVNVTSLATISEKRLGIGGGGSSTTGGGGGGLLGGETAGGGSSSLQAITAEGPNGESLYSVYFNKSNLLQLAQTTELTISTGNFTIEAWIYLFSLPTSTYWRDINIMVICSVGTVDSNDGWQFRLSKQYIEFGGNSDNLIIRERHNMTVGVWYHVAVSRSGNIYRLFRDGVMISEDTTGTSPGTGQTFYVGAEQLGYAHFHGYISNLRLIKGTAIYTGNFDAPTSELTAVPNTSVILCQGTTINDKSGNNLTVTASGASLPVIAQVTPFDKTTKLTLFPAQRSIPGLYDDPQRKTAGDPGRPGRIVFTVNEHSATAINATGGTITQEPIPGTSLAYKYHTFTSSGTFQVVSAGVNDTMEVFAVGGGGGGGYSGGGSGQAILKTDLNLTAGSYIVTVGNGGDKVDSTRLYTYRWSSGVKLAIRGNNWGGSPGEETSLISNDLTTYGFPDNYVKLIASLKCLTIYISPGGSETNTGRSATSPWPSIEYAELRLTDVPTISSAFGLKDFVCYVMLPGVYQSVTDINTYANQAIPPLTDGYSGRAEGVRVFVCAPGKVTFELPVGSQNIGAHFDSPLSAVYGAIFNYRNTSTSAENNALLGYSSGATVRHHGNFYNCVFNVDQTSWALHRNAWAGYVENCTFVTTNDETSLGNGAYAEFKKCIFTKKVGTKLSGVLNDCAFDKTILDFSTYKVTGDTARGIEGGKYGWYTAKTTLAKNQKAVAIGALGGGGGMWYGDLAGIGLPAYYNTETVVDSIRGTGGGSNRYYMSDYYNERLINTTLGTNGNKVFRSVSALTDYSYYGFNGGNPELSLPTDPAPVYANETIYASGGGGAGSPGFDHAHGGAGGSPIEWPINSGSFYAAGGPSRSDLSTPELPGSGGKGSAVWTNNRLSPGSTGTSYGETATAGKNGILIIRYKVTDTETAAVDRFAKFNPVAYGGTVTTTSTYRQHAFTQSGTFILERLPDNCYIECLVVGGGGGGGPPTRGQGGQGGDLKYSKFNASNIPPGSYRILVGSGGAGASGGLYGLDGSPSRFSGPITRFDSNNNLIYVNGSGGYRGWYYGNQNAGKAQNGIALSVPSTSLFSDHTTIYGGHGGNGSSAGNLNQGGDGGGGNGGTNSVAAQPGTPGLGGGGGGGSQAFWGETLSGASGGSGIVLIRYTWFS